MANYEEKFNSISELYERILPALKTKTEELKREKLNFITPKLIWQYCLINKWSNKKDLRIYEVVDDILNLSPLKLEIYYKKNLNRNDKIER